MGKASEMTPEALVLELITSRSRLSDIEGRRLLEALKQDFAGAPQARLLACGLCYEENGEEVHPHPECTYTP